MKQREGVNGGHRVMRGLNATNAMSQGLIKTSSALLPRSGHAHMHLSDSSVGFVGGWVAREARVRASMYNAQSSLLAHTVWDKWPYKNKLRTKLKWDYRETDAFSLGCNN